MKTAEDNIQEHLNEEKSDDRVHLITYIYESLGEEKFGAWLDQFELLLDTFGWDWLGWIDDEVYESGVKELFN